MDKVLSTMIKISKYMKYRRKLTSTEAQRHFILINYKSSTMFPDCLTTFMLKVSDKEYPVKLDKHNRIWAGPFHHAIDMKQNAVIEITKNKDGLYVLNQVK
jgi:hypothetical protein